MSRATSKGEIYSKTTKHKILFSFTKFTVFKQSLNRSIAKQGELLCRRWLLDSKTFQVTLQPPSHSRVLK